MDYFYGIDIVGILDNALSKKIPVLSVYMPLLKKICAFYKSRIGEFSLQSHLSILTFLAYQSCKETAIEEYINAVAK